MNKPIKNLAASIHQSLLNKSRQTGQPFNELIQYYGIERLLYRLSVSDYADQFILKGALMFHAWGLTGGRPTRDIDLLGHAPNALDHIQRMFETICSLDVPPDGLEFDQAIETQRIKEDADYEGVRVNVLAYLDTTRIHIQIDIGFADVVTPSPEKLKYPTLLDFPAPQMYGYPRETIIAEKFHAVTVLGAANSRMKDFHDLYTMISGFEFDGATIQRALQRTFQNRSTNLLDEGHVIFSAEFAEEKALQWSAFTRKIKRSDAPSMKQLLAVLEAFILPILSASREGLTFEKKWKNGWG